MYPGSRIGFEKGFVVGMTGGSCGPLASFVSAGMSVIVAGWIIGKVKSGRVLEQVSNVEEMLRL